MRMVKRLSIALATFALLAMSSVESRAQATGGVSMGYSDIAAVLGLGGLGGAGIAFGARYEKIIKALPDMNDGLLGIMVGVDWYSYSVPGYSLSFIPISASANYHFKMDNKKFDPFVGAGLGYRIASASGFAGSYSSGIYFIGVIGMRYFLSDKMALYADAGAGSGALHVGLSWKLGGGS